MIYGTVEDHKPRGVTGYNLGQNPRGRRYLLIPALVGYQSLQNLLPDALLVLCGDALLAALLDGSKPVFGRRSYCLEVRFCPLIPPFRFVPRVRFILRCYFRWWQSSGKVKKFYCDFWLEMLRESAILVSFLFDACPI